MPSRKDFLLSIIREIGAFQMQHFGKEIEFETKSNHMDFVSFVDVTSEKMFIEKLGELFPDDVVFGEEEHDKNRDYSIEKHLWIIDPLDGTVLYKHRLPFFGVMIAYIEDGRIQFSSIFLPAMNELYFADETGTYKNDEKIHVSNTKKLRTSFLNLQFFSCLEIFKKEEDYFDFLKKVGVGIDVYSAAYSMTACADGRIDGGGFYPSQWYDPDSKNIWDSVPGGFIVQQAGGKVTTFGKNIWDIWSSKMVYSNSHIHKELRKAFNDL